MSAIYSSGTTTCGDAFAPSSVSTLGSVEIVHLPVLEKCESVLLWEYVEDDEEADHREDDRGDDDEGDHREDDRDDDDDDEANANDNRDKGEEEVSEDVAQAGADSDLEDSQGCEAVQGSGAVVNTDPTLWAGKLYTGVPAPLAAAGITWDATKKPLGQGAFGTVFRAKDAHGNRTAVKVQLDDGDNKGLGATEAMVLAECGQHENVVGHKGEWLLTLRKPTGECARFHYLAIEFAEEGDLTRLVLQMGGVLDVPVAIIAGYHIACGLSALHSRGWVHRDLKEDNVLVSGDGTFKVADPGLSACIKDEGVADGVCGTPGYIPLEAFLDEGYGVEFDLFSLGVILYRLVTGVSPFEPGHTYAEYFRKLDLGPHPALFTAPVWTEYPELTWLIKECLLAGPDERGNAEWVADYLHFLFRLVVLGEPVLEEVGRYGVPLDQELEMRRQSIALETVRARRQRRMPKVCEVVPVELVLPEDEEEEDEGLSEADGVSTGTAQSEEEQGEKEVTVEVKKEEEEGEAGDDNSAIVATSAEATATLTLDNVTDFSFGTFAVELSLPSLIKRPSTLGSPLTLSPETRGQKALPMERSKVLTLPSQQVVLTDDLHAGLYPKPENKAGLVGSESGNSSCITYASEVCPIALRGYVVHDSLRNYSRPACVPAVRPPLDDVEDSESLLWIGSGLNDYHSTAFPGPASPEDQDDPEEHSEDQDRPKDGPKVDLQESKSKSVVPLPDQLVVKKKRKTLKDVWKKTKTIAKKLFR